MTSLLNFIKIYQLVQKLLGGDAQTDRRTDIQTDRQTGDLKSLTFLFKEIRLKMGLIEATCEGVDWIHLAQDMVQWRTLVNTVMTLRFHKIQRFFEKLSDY
jgi:hypothetical protein